MVKISSIIKQLGGEQYVAYRLEVHQLSVKRWYKNGIPKKYWKRLIALSEKGLTSDILLNAKTQ